MSSDDPIMAATEVRHVLGIKPDEPILDIASLLESAGIKVYLYKSLILNFGMSLNESDGGPVVAVNTDEKISIERQIFTAAHELGHLILHKDSYNEETIEENPEEEKQANIFASHFIMTDKLFKSKLKETQGKDWVDRVLHIKRFFKVSYKTVLRRLADENYIDSQKINIFQEFAKDYKKLYKHDLKDHYEPDALSDSEPEALTKSDFMAERYNRLVYEAYSKDIITTSEAAELLGLAIDSFRELTRSWRLMDEREG
jgi:Zn-dependent peptidase ImmA (M78 family)